MARELNKQLFADSSPSSPAPEKEPKATSWSEQDWKFLAHQLEALKKRMKEQESQLANTNSRLNEVVNTSKAKFEQLSGSVQRLEEYFKSSLQDLKSKYASLTGKITERKVSEEKIEDLIERHNQVVQNFETRVNQLQKVISEQEMQLMNSRSALKEAQQEIERLKRL